MSTLIVRHVPKSDPLRFQVLEPDGEPIPPADFRPAAGYPVEGRPKSDLMYELRWYLEDFLEYPFHPETEHAERVLAALRSWSEDAFTTLFGQGDGAALFERATLDGEEKLRLRVESADPRVLSWPWESLRRPGAGPLGRLCQVERSLGLDMNPLPVRGLPRDRVNILLVTARPYAHDVDYRSVSRPVIDLVEEEGLSVDVHVLRPPTFERLEEHLRERPRHYHILHFDGHGSFDPKKPEGEKGCLIFEDKIGADDPVTTRQLDGLVREHGVPVVVLNACQSATHDTAAETAFASVAASLVAAGARSVVAMAYSLRVGGAREFLPDFYRGLFASGSVAEGVRAGRGRMFEQQGRVCARGRFDLEDWLIPVLYQQEDVDFSFAAEARRAAKGAGPHLPSGGNEGGFPRVMEIESKPLHGFVGRDGAILKLERALRQPKAGILVHGLGGIGKTTLAHGFVEWLARTEGLGMGCFWLTFQEVRSAEYVWNRLGDRLVGPQIALMEAEEKIGLLANIFKENRFLIVWDSFELVAGIEGTMARPTFSEEERGQLRAFLTALRGGATKVLITSRSEESWLGFELNTVSLLGLLGEDRWAYCEQILGDLSVPVDRTDPDLMKLMDLLSGHPLAMRVILSELRHRKATELIQALTDLEDDDAVARLHATLGFAEESLDANLRPLLVGLAYHERFVERNLFEMMAQRAGSSPLRAEIDALLRALSHSGILRPVVSSVFEMHPALTGFLQSSVLKRADAELREQWARAFVYVLAEVAEIVGGREAHEQRVAFQVQGANFLAAAREADRLEMLTDASLLVQALGVYAFSQNLYEESACHYRRYAELQKGRGNERGEATAYHQLGMISQKRLDFAAAEEWYLKSLEITEEMGDEAGASTTHHMLGFIAEERRQFEAAEAWYQKSLDIKRRLGDDHGVGSTCHNLGRVFQERGDFDAAEKWYRESLRIKERLGVWREVAYTSHQLGRIAQERGDFDAAEKWCRRTLGIAEMLGDQEIVAKSCFLLGFTFAHGRLDLEAAEKWVKKALEILERLGDERGVAGACGELGVVASFQQRFEEAGHWFVRAVSIFVRIGDQHNIQKILMNFKLCFQQAPASGQAKLRDLWEAAGLPWPEEKE